MQSTRVVLLGFAAAIAAAVGACQTDGGGSSNQDRGSCYVLIECAAQLEPSIWDAYMDTYGPFGTCWNAGVAQWQSCRDQCKAALESLNQVETCGTCTLLGDCAEFGPTAYCLQGYCAGGSTPDDGGADDETFGTTLETGDGDGDPTTTGDGDGDPTTTGDGDGDPTTTGDGDGDGDLPPNCGWDGGNGYYACGSQGEDPRGINPIECPGGLVEGDPCDTVRGIGCCDQNGDNWYCTEDQTLFLDDC